MTSSPTISKLTEDILWFIFMINTDNPAPFDPEQEESHWYQGKSHLDPLPLDTARKSSQVCHEWRHILLKTSAIWGRLMDWRSLNQEMDHWRDEVLRRSGTSLLWLDGHDYLHDYNNPKHSTITFFNRLVDKQWQRIQRLSVCLNRGHLIEGVQSVARCAAPYLESFIFSDFHNDHPHFQGLMFAGHAPQLRVFHAVGTHCNLEATWMSNIQELSLGNLFSNKEVCDVLPHMPRLEFLELKDHRIIDGYRSPPIRLPHLRILRIWGGISYLDDIEPAPGCSLHLHLANDPNNDLDVDLLRTCENKIAKILHSYISFHPTKRLYLECRSTFILGVRQLPKHLHRFEQSDTFEISLLPSLKFFNDVVEHALEMFTFPVLTTLTDLMLDYTILQPQVYHAFKMFALMFQSLTNLWIHENGIPVLLQLQDEMTDRHPLIFPELRTLVVLSVTFGITAAHSWPNHLELFLSLRRDLGVPITTLDLTHIRQILRDLDFLEGFTGMTVIWKQDGNVVEYECGSGRERCLRFHSQLLLDTLL